ncbi:MAG: DR2241 family protein [Dehalococcoidia bacterium]
MTEVPLATALIGELTLSYFDDRVLVEGPPGPGAAREIDPDPVAIRALVRLDGHGRYRPFSGLRGLPGGWRASCSTLAEADAIVEAVYPLALDHLSSHEGLSLRTVPLGLVLERQSGRYAVAGALEEAGRALATTTLCGACVRAPVWAGRIAGMGQIPCPEACSMLVGLCREAALWQTGMPSPSPVDPTAPLGAFDQPGNPFREAYLARRTSGHE